MRKPTICIGENKDADQLRGNREADQRLRIIQFLFYLNPKFQASSSFLSLYRPVCVGPGRKPRRPVFSRRGSFILGLGLVVFQLWRICGFQIFDIFLLSFNIRAASLVTNNVVSKQIRHRPSCTSKEDG